jgi:hypothetical protein
MRRLSLLGLTVGAGLLVAAAPFSFQWSPARTLSLSLDKADARIGRPLTPLSVAGVHRRMYRRAYRRNFYYGAAGVGAAAAGAYYYGRPAYGYYGYQPWYPYRPWY